MMKQKRFLSMLIAFMFAFQLLGGLPAKDVKAAEKIDFPFITDVKITDKNGNDLGENVSKKSEIRIDYTWDIPSDSDVKEGDYFIMTLPEEMKIVADIDQPIMFDGEKVADLHIGTDRSVKITFTKFVEDKGGVKGGFWASCHFEESKIPEENPVEIKFIIPGGSDKVIKVDFEETVYEDTKVTKESTAYNADTNEITWKIIINSDKKSKIYKGAQVIDKILDGQSYVKDSATISGGAKGSFSYDKDSNTLKYTFSEDSTGSHEITFKTKPDLTNASHGEKITVKNKATLININKKGEDLGGDTNEATHTITVNFIEKSGKYAKRDGKNYIDWTITVNKNLQTIDNAKITDTFDPAKLALDKSSVKVNHTTMPEGTESGEFSYDNNGKIIFNLGNITDKKIITFSTEVIDTEATNSNTEQKYTNKALLTGEGIKDSNVTSSGVGVATNVIKKEGAGYDASTHKIKWKITVNENKIPIKNAVIEDIINDDQKYVEGTFKIGKLGETLESVADSEVFTTPNTLKYNFGEDTTITDTYIIEYETEVASKEEYGNNLNKYYKNKVSLTGEGIKGKVEYEGQQYYSSSVIKKTGAGYDYINREITWKIVVNANKMEINNAVVKDYIPKGHEYVMGSFKVGNDSITEGENGLKYIKAGENDSEKTGTIEYNLGDISSTYTITFKTKVTDLSIFDSNGDKKIENTAYLDGDEIAKDIKEKGDTGSQTIKNEVIKKQSHYTNGNDYIDWTIRTNSNFSIPTKGASITDTLQDGLVLQTDTVKLNKVTVDSEGKTTVGEEVPITSDNIKYDITTGVFEFIFPDMETGVFQLSFRTIVTKTGEYTNTAIFKGQGVDNEESEEIVQVWFSSGGGWAEGYDRKIKITKVDDKDESKTLKGAKFELLDQYKNVIAVSNETDNSGVVVFDKLKPDLTYYVREAVSPYGYEKNDNVYEFKIDKSQQGIEYKFKNIKIKGNIEFTKTGEDSDENGLKGAIFTLYNSENEVIKTATSDENGLVKFEGIDYGKYTIKEFKPPVGYLKSDVKLEAKITKNAETVKATTIEDEPKNELKNNKIRGSVILKKVDVKGNVLEGAEFSIYSKDDTTYKTPLYTAESDKNGVVEFKGVAYGKYVIKETKAPSGYYVSNKIIDNINIKTHEEIVTVSENFVNHEVTSPAPDNGSIKLKKVNEQGFPLNGVEFVLLDENQNIVGVQTTSINGVLHFTNLKYGKYTVKETRTVTGYSLLKDTLTAVVSESNKVYDIGTVTNNKIRADIKINKLDEIYIPLQGAEFTLYDSNGKAVKTGVSGVDGFIVFENIEYGDYTIKETKAPEGYALSKDAINVYIRTEGTQEFRVKNLPLPPGEVEIPTNPGDGGKPGEPDPGEGTVTPPGQGGGTTTPGNGDKGKVDKYDTGKDKNGNKIPQTGGVVDTNVLTALGLTTVAAGVILLIKSRRKGEES